MCAAAGDVTCCPKQHFLCPENSGFHNTSGFHGVPECLRTVGPIPAYPTAAFAAAASHQSAITYHNVLSLLSPASPTTATIDSQLLAANLSDAATRVPPPPDGSHTKQTQTLRSKKGGGWVICPTQAVGSARDRRRASPASSWPTSACCSCWTLAAPPARFDQREATRSFGSGVNYAPCSFS